MTDTPITAEIKRKLIHLSSLWIPISLLSLGTVTTLWLLCLAFVGCLFGEWLVRQTNQLGSFAVRLLSPIMRDHERNQDRYSGATYMILACILCALVAEASLAATAICVLVVSDTLAAIVGMKWGCHKLLGKKTYLGTFVFFASSWLIATVGTGAWVYYSVEGTTGNLLVCTWACAIVTLLELTADRIGIDDNFLIPLGFIGSYHVVFFVMGVV